MVTINRRAWLAGAGLTLTAAWLDTRSGVAAAAEIGKISLSLGPQVVLRSAAVERSDGRWALAVHRQGQMFKTLREVIAYCNEPDKVVPGQKGRDASIVPLQLTPGELEDLEHFLLTLTDRRFTARATTPR